MRFYPNRWNGIAGFLDDHKNLDEKVREELQEELGFEKKDIEAIGQCEIFPVDDRKHKKTWIVFPVLVISKTDKLKLDWEAQDFRWINLKEIKKFKTTPIFERVLKNALKLRKK